MARRILVRQDSGTPTNQGQDAADDGMTGLVNSGVLQDVHFLLR
jgi:hypothetical protein